MKEDEQEHKSRSMTQRLSSEHPSEGHRVSTTYLVATGAGALFAGVISLFTTFSSAVYWVIAAVGFVIGYWIAKR